MFMSIGGGGRTPVLCPVTHNLARVCPPLEGLHVSSAANHDTHVRRAEEHRFFFFHLCCFSGLKGPDVFLLMSSVKKLFTFGRIAAKRPSVLPLFDCTTLLSPSLFLSLSPSLPLSPLLNPSASCRSVRLPVSVPIRFHLIHVTSINTQSSPDKSRPLSPPLCLSCVALHHSVFPSKLFFATVVGHNV